MKTITTLFIGLFIISSPSLFSQTQNIYKKILSDEIFIGGEAYSIQIIQKINDQTTYLFNLEKGEDNFKFTFDKLSADDNQYKLIRDSILKKIPLKIQPSLVGTEAATKDSSELKIHVKAIVLKALQKEKKKDYSDINPLYQNDFSIGKKNYNLSLREINNNGAVDYYFELKNELGKQSFSMSDIKPDGQKLEIFRNYLVQKNITLHQSDIALISPEDTLYFSNLAKQIIHKDSSNTRRLNLNDKSRITKILDKTIEKSNYEKPKIKEATQNLKDSLRASLHEDDILWLEKELDRSEILNQEHKKEQKEKLEELASEFLFKAYLATISPNQDTPAVGRIAVSSVVPVYYFKPKCNIVCGFGDGWLNCKWRQFTCGCKQVFTSRKKRKKNKDQLNSKVKYFDVNEIEVEFEYGQIANIVVKTKDLDENNFPIHFENRIPISYSTKANVSRDSYGIRMKGIPLFRVGRNQQKQFIYFEDIMFNDYKLNNKTENYSPADTVITLKPKANAKVIYKKNVVDILQVKVFSDFFGWNGDTPNGIIQTEISRKFPLWTNSFQTNRNKYLGAVNYIIPRFQLTRIGEEDKKLILMPDTSNSSGQYLASTLDLYRYSNFTFGGDVNLFYRRGGPTQINFSMDLGLYFSQINGNSIAVSDSIEIQDIIPKISAGNLQLKLNFDFNPHPHLGFRLSYNPILHTIFDEVVKQTDGSSDGIYNNVVSIHRLKKDRINEFGEIFIHKFEFLGHAKIRKESNGEFFLRYAYHMYQKDLNQNFQQLQLGYSFNLFSGKAGQKITPPTFL